jgi:methylated-DNA-[protein]-cysteine S-methyltransferase
MTSSVVFDSPIGPLRIFADGERLVALDFLKSSRASNLKSHSKSKENGAFFKRVEKALHDYFEKGKPLPSFPYASRSGTSFRQKVWRALEKIPFGQTRSYGEIAAMIGSPGAARAVGTACGANSLPLFIPCHRVVAANGLGGFSSGMEIKKQLLRLEGVLPPR